MSYIDVCVCVCVSTVPGHPIEKVEASEHIKSSKQPTNIKYTCEKNECESWIFIHHRKRI
jgi:hypothetical protein